VNLRKNHRSEFSQISKAYGVAPYSGRVRAVLHKYTAQRKQVTLLIEIYSGEIYQWSYNGTREITYLPLTSVFDANTQHHYLASLNKKDNIYKTTVRRRISVVGQWWNLSYIAYIQHIRLPIASFIKDILLLATYKLITGWNWRNRDKHGREKNSDQINTQ